MSHCGTAHQNQIQSSSKLAILIQLPSVIIRSKKSVPIFSLTYSSSFTDANAANRISSAPVGLEKASGYKINTLRLAAPVHNPISNRLIYRVTQISYSLTGLPLEDRRRTERQVRSFRGWSSIPEHLGPRRTMGQKAAWLAETSSALWMLPRGLGYRTNYLGWINIFILTVWNMILINSISFTSKTSSQNKNFPLQFFFFWEMFLTNVLKPILC